MQVINIPSCPCQSPLSSFFHGFVIQPSVAPHPSPAFLAPAWSFQPHSFRFGGHLSMSRCDGRVFFGLDGTCLEHFGSNLRPAQVPQQLCFPCSSSSLCIFSFISCIFMVVSSFSHCMV